MKPRSRPNAKDQACPHCGRFFFVPCDELLGMRHVHMRADQSPASAGLSREPADQTPEQIRK